MREQVVRGRVWLLVLGFGLAAACSSTMGSPQSDAASSPPPPPPPPSCFAVSSADGGAVPGLESPAHGDINGDEISARLCQGGAVAYMQRGTPTEVPPNQLRVMLSTSTVAPQSDFQIDRPIDATRLELSAAIVVNNPQPAEYNDSITCGDIVLCAILPVPASVNCPPMLEGDVCPPGCMLSGPHEACVPIEPSICYEARSSTCNGIESAGTWGLKLTSVEPYPGPDAGDSDTGLFVVHGSLNALMTKPTLHDDGGVTLSTVTLQATF